MLQNLSGRAINNINDLKRSTRVAPAASAVDTARYYSASLESLQIANEFAYSSGRVPAYLSQCSLVTERRPAPLYLVHEKNSR